MPPISSAYINGSGSTLTISLGKAIGSPVVTGIGGSPALRINGGPTVTPTGVLWSDPAKEDTGVACATFILPVTVAPGDTVTVTTPAGCLVAATGPSDPLLDAPVANYAGSSVLPQTPPEYRSMKVGWNTGIGDFYTPMVLYADYCKPAQHEWQSGAYPSRSAQGNHWQSSGMPRYPGSDWARIITWTVDPSYLDGGYPVASPGRFSLRYKNLRNAWLIVNGQLLSDSQAQLSSAGGWNYKVYPSVPPNPTQICPNIQVVIDTEGNEDARVELYDQFVTDPTNPPLFHPKVLEKLAGSACHRTNDHINLGSPLCEIDDWNGEEYCNYNVLAEHQAGRVGVVKFEPYNSSMASGGLPYARPGLVDFAVKVTTATPHNLRPGAFINFFLPGAPSNGLMLTMNMADGTTQDIGMDRKMCYPLDATSFVITNIWLEKSIATTVPPAGSLIVRMRSGIPPRHHFLLANAVKGMGVHLSIPHGATDDCVRALAQMAVQTLGQGRKVWLEYSNEPWNWGGAYPQNKHFKIMGYEKGLERQAAGDASWFENWDTPRAYYYICRAGQINRIWREAWAAAGRREDDLVCIMSGLRFDGNTTRQYIDFSERMDPDGKLAGEPGYSGPIPFDRVSFAPYLRLYPDGNHPSDADYNARIAAIYDAMTEPQAMDVGDAYCDHLATTIYGTSIPRHLESIRQSARPNTKLSAYEGGPEMMGGYGSNPHRSQLNAAWNFDPRALGQMLALLKLYDGTLDMFCKSGLGGIMGVEGDTKCYSAYTGPAQEPGTGDGSDGKLNNRPYIVDPATGQPLSKINLAPSGNLLVSPVGEAVRRWNIAAAPPPPSPNTARFLRIDAATHGNWKGRYGADGYHIAQDTSTLNPRIPSYATAGIVGGSNFVWDAATTDIRALQKATGADRIAAVWYNGSLFNIDIRITDGLPHTLSLYLLDWDRQNRTATMEVLDAARGTTLDVRSVSGYGEGLYLAWEVAGHIIVRVTNTGPWSAVISGIFFDPAGGGFLSTDASAAAMAMGM